MIAAMAMQGMLLSRPPSQWLAMWSVEQADALIEALNNYSHTGENK
jgi:hypothetical protein